MIETAGNTNEPIHGIIAQFESATDLFHAAEKIRDAGYRRWDTFSPFPIHGMNEAMGIGKSWLSALVFLGGLTGFSIGVILQFYTSVIEYPLVVAGKPVNFFTVPAFFPVMFELTILLSSFTAVFGMLMINGLPRYNHPLFNWDRFVKVSEDGFFINIESTDPLFSEQRVTELLESLGGKHLTLIHGD
ncbi:MAG: DUF3341 domain-containing protein [Chthoniobacterales bacterium]